jgi:hypothetical protein
LKTIHRLFLLAAVSPVAFICSSCSKSSEPTTTQTVKAAAKEAVADVKEAVADSWDTIKDYTHEKRDDFATRLERMSDKSEAEMKTLNAKMTGLPDAAAVKRDRAVKEFNQARAGLKIQLAELRAATAETWASAKEKTAQAWQRVQTAAANVKASSAS